MNCSQCVFYCPDPCPTLNAFCATCRQNHNPYRYCIAISDTHFRKKPFSTTSDLQLAKLWLEKLATHDSMAVLHKWSTVYKHYC